jgi:hypothetical protein
VEGEKVVYLRTNFSSGVVTHDTNSTSGDFTGIVTNQSPGETGSNGVNLM